MDNQPVQHRTILQDIARRAMAERGLRTDFSPASLAELAALSGGDRLAAGDGAGERDLRELPWCSIDNDDSRDLDQLTVSAPAEGGALRVLVAVADVDGRVTRDTALDADARLNTTSVYTVPQVFPLLPERLSTDLTSLNEQADRHALVIEMVVASSGALVDSSVSRALVRNQARLTYNSVGAWLEGNGPAPEPLRGVAGLADNLRAQHRAAEALSAFRHERGALQFHTIEARAVFELDQLASFDIEDQNSAKELIEDLMIAANGVTARFLEERGCPSLRRVVRAPKRWERIVELAASHHFRLPAEPDAKALGVFLAQSRDADPLRFPDLSLSIVKLMGSGEYVAEAPGLDGPGHFGLAVKDYGHSTAPNRRYPDLVTHRLLKAALAGQAPPYDLAALTELARHCTQREDDANKVERLVRKSAAALLLHDQRGQRFEGIVTGAAAKGTWVRVFQPPVEGRVVRGERGLDVGERVVVELVDTNVERGFIDFARVA